MLCTLIAKLSSIRWMPSLCAFLHILHFVLYNSSIKRASQENMVFENPDTLADARARLDKFTEDVQMQVLLYQKPIKPICCSIRKQHVVNRTFPG